MKNIALILTGLVISTQLTVTAFAQDTTIPSSMTTSPTAVRTVSPSKAEVQALTSQEIKGEVLRKNGNVLIIQTDNGNKEVTLPTNSKVTKNGMGSDIGNIKPNDSVTVTQSNGQVLSIDVTAGEVMDFGKWAIPAALLGLLVLALVISLLSKASRSHIKTTVG